MVIIDEKSMRPPPPPYAPPPSQHAFPQTHPAYQYGPQSPLSPGGSVVRRPPVTITMGAMPAQILLQIVYSTFPTEPGVDVGRVERQRKTLYWMSVALRLVNRAFYTACMHVLRSTYLPAYDSLIRPPYTSDPFPLSSATAPPPFTPTPTRSASSSTTSLTPDRARSRSPPAGEGIHSPQRETAVLDLFIALKVREDVWADESELHLGREESFGDLFQLAQPRARVEDLVRHYGVREGVMSTSAVGAGTKGRVAFADVSVAFSARRVGLVLNVGGGRKRTVVEVARTREERLESAAKRLVKELKVWLGGYR